MDSIVAKGLTKRFDDFEVLKGVDLSVRRGETFGLLGPNGAGKTTLVNILTTMSKPTAGEAWVGGHSVTQDGDAVRRSLGVVFQTNTLDPIMTPVENLRIHGQLYKMPKAELEEAIPRLIDLVGLSDRANERVGKYSGGMRRRVEIIRAILHKPQVLILDEPTVALDPHSRALIWDHIRVLAKQFNITILVTTHYMEEADRLCDRVAIMDGGAIVRLDTPMALKAALGGDRVSLQLSADATKVAELVEALPNVLGVTPEGQTLSLRLREPATTIPSIMHVVAESGIRIEHMDHKPSSMDDVFLSTTTRRSKKPKKKKPNRFWAMLRGSN